jgi:aryl-alcohol dehydrogenase-like predicted oxidoreductase
MRITGPGIWGEPADRDEAKRVLRRAVELGVDLIDTADSYGPFVSEDLIREALHTGRGDDPYDGVVVATKAGLIRTGPGDWHALGRPEYLRFACEMSLRRLDVERIDLFQLHRIDPQVPAEEQFGVLADLQREGKVRHLGLSEVTVDELEHAQQHLEVATVQNRYNLLDRRLGGRPAPLRGARASGSCPGSRSPPATSPGPVARSTTSPPRPARPRPSSRSRGCCELAGPAADPRDLVGRAPRGERRAAATVELSDEQLARLDALGS